MPKRLRIQLVRPYQDEEAFIVAEGWTLRRRSMLLVDAPELADGTEVRCDVTLISGQSLIRAEGRIVGHVAPRGGRPGGLKLRFQRVAPDTQQLIQRVLERATGTAKPADSRPAASSAPLPAPDGALDSSPQAARVTLPCAEPKPRRSSSSGLHKRVVPPVESPPDREQLLDRLRARQRHRVEHSEPRSQRHRVEHSEPRSQHPKAGKDTG